MSPLALRELEISGMCTACQDKIFAPVWCSACPAECALTLFSERTGLDPNVFACRGCGKVADEDGDPDGTVHIAHRCLCCSEPIVAFYTRRVDGVSVDHRYGPAVCPSCVEVGDDGAKHLFHCH